jgi:hypothetical protein
MIPFLLRSPPPHTHTHNTTQHNTTHIDTTAKHKTRVCVCVCARHDCKLVCSLPVRSTFFFLMQELHLAAACVLLFVTSLLCFVPNTTAAQVVNIVSKRRMHPSIVQWETFNEGGGMSNVSFVGDMVALVRSVDPTRPVDSASGGHDLCNTPPVAWLGCGKFGNMSDLHHYPTPEAPNASKVNPLVAKVNGEYGGLLLRPENMSPPRVEWAQGKCHGYQTSNNSSALTATFVNFSSSIKLLRDESGLSASVYTQTTDCETECNGLLTCEIDQLHYYHTCTPPLVIG